jgi:hypothetical protein
MPENRARRYGPGGGGPKGEDRYAKGTAFGLTTWHEPKSADFDGGANEAMRKPGSATVLDRNRGTLKSF